MKGEIKMTVKRGEIYYITNLYGLGNEMMGGRPGIIVSNDIGNEHSDVVEIVYLTTKEKKPMPTHVQIECTAPSTALCEQVHSISKERIGNFIRTCTSEEMKQIDAALLCSLGLDTAEVEPGQKVTDAKTLEMAADLVKLQTERNLYKSLYESLIDKVTA